MGDVVFIGRPIGLRKNADGTVYDENGLDYRYEPDPEAAEAARLAELREREESCWEGCDEA